MKNGIFVLSVAGGLLLGGTAAAQPKPPDCVKPGAPEMIEGEVTRIDVNGEKLVIRARDGVMHEFQASKETLSDYKVGDPIKARRRPGPPCPD